MATSVLLAAGIAGAQTGQGTQAQQPQSETMTGQSPQMPMMQPGNQDGRMMQGPGMMHGPGMMQGGPGHAGMGPHMMLMMMAMVDADGSGALSLAEVQAVHARMFGYADADGDGELTVEELRAFMHGEARAPAR